jgi:hypothetical protein
VWLTSVIVRIKADPVILNDQSQLLAGRLQPDLNYCGGSMLYRVVERLLGYQEHRQLHVRFRLESTIDLRGESDPGLFLQLPDKEGQGFGEAGITNRRTGQISNEPAQPATATSPEVSKSGTCLSRSRRWPPFRSSFTTRERSVTP